MRLKCLFIEGGEEGVVLTFMHGRSRMTVDRGRGGGRLPRRSLVVPLF